MSKQGFKIVLIILTAIAMFYIFNNKFGSGAEKISDNAFLVDLRTPQEFAEGHVEGSVNIPLDKVESEIARFKGKENIVVFCRSGNRSGQAKAILERHGIKDVTNGGSWQDVNKLVNK